jgi:hypothetical protein
MGHADCQRCVPPGPYPHPVCEVRETVCVRASIDSTPPTGVDGVGTIQDFAAPRVFDSRRKSEPTPQVGRDLLDHLRYADATGSMRLFVDSLLKAVDGLGGNAPPRFSLAGESESEKLPLPRSGHGALRLVYLEFEAMCDEARNALHHSLSRSFAANIVQSSA